jgi:hypothetical protein
MVCSSFYILLKIRSQEGVRGVGLQSGEPVEVVAPSLHSLARLSFLDLCLASLMVRGIRPAQEDQEPSGLGPGLILTSQQRRRALIDPRTSST